jgi:hypothetical protein
MKIVATSLLERCENDTHTLEMGTWEFSRTLKNSEFNCKGLIRLKMFLISLESY